MIQPATRPSAISSFASVFHFFQYINASHTSISFLSQLDSKLHCFRLTTSFQYAIVAFPFVDLSENIASSLIMDSASRPTSELSGGREPSEQQQRQQRWWRIGLFRGMANDIRRRAPYYWGDWKDAWDYRVVPATVYIYFAK